MTKVVILAGGRGTRLSEETRAIPKPMVEIAGKPILLHLMNSYAAQGFTDFVIALGYRGYMIKEYFANFRTHRADFTIDLGTGTREYLNSSPVDWRVTLVDTGESTMTGGRLRRLAQLLPERFMLTYGDGLADVDLPALLAHHEAQGATATVTAVTPEPRFGALELSDGWVSAFREKPADQARINGGFFVMEPAIQELLTDDDCVLEREPLATLAARRQLGAYLHDGFWKPMDTLRDRDELAALCREGREPWLR